jgi:murein DD-endopeptidase MepM/ murein hydrolase activator NlpD
MGSRTVLLVLIVIIILLGIIVSDQLRIRRLEGVLGNLLILGFSGDSLVVYHPMKISEQKLLISPEFADRFTEYKSPFWDGRDGEGSRAFQDLINEYVRNRFQDHYGSKRGSSSIPRIHEGIDLFVPENSEVYPLGYYGVVTRVSHNPNHMEWVEYTRADGGRDSTQVEYGKIVEILYPEGLISIYVHLNEVYVEAGDEVFMDTVVGLTGVTGNLTRSGKDSHLHLELRYLDGTSFDPRHRLHYRGTSMSAFARMLRLAGS